VSSRGVEAGESSRDPESSPGGPRAGLDDQPGTLNPPAAGAIVTSGAQDPAAEAAVSAGGPAETRNPGADVAMVTAEGQSGAADAEPVGAADGWEQAGPQDVVLTLQRHLLPTGLPILPRVRLVGRHLVGARAPGGGCFDAFALAGGMVALMVGHAPGDGPQAVAAMAELRTVLRQALRDGSGLSGALTQMDAFAVRSPAIAGATVCLALLDPATGSLRYASAGRPAPLLCTAWDEPAGGGARAVSFLPDSGGGPLGRAADRDIAGAVLAPGALLLLCGDGADDEPGGDVAAERFAAAVAAALAAGEPRPGTPAGGDARPGTPAGGDARPGTPAEGDAQPAEGDAQPADSTDRMCADVAERLARGRPHADATVLAAHWLPEPGEGLAMRFPAEPTALRPMRARLARWLDEIGASPVDRVDTELAVYEAAANAIVHGRPARGTATVAVDVGLDGTGGVLIEVSDRGRWQARTPGAERPGGRGLSVISKVTDELSIAPSPDGTTVIMRRALTHPVTVDRAPA
jgi:anti-sigma regulatory factor (Ser/Thr protein kinase)